MDASTPDAEAEVGASPPELGDPDALRLFFFEEDVSFAGVFRFAVTLATAPPSLDDAEAEACCASMSIGSAATGIGSGGGGGMTRGRRTELLGTLVHLLSIRSGQCTRNLNVGSC